MLEIVIHHLFAPISLVLSFIGNILGIFVMNRKELIKIGPIKMYQYLFIANLIFSLFILDNYLLYTNGIGFSIISNLTCKLYRSIVYPIMSLTPLIMVYIVLERYLSIKFPVESNFLRRNNIQFIYILIIITFDFFIFSYLPFVSEIEITNRTNSYNNITIETKSCEIISKYKVFSYLIPCLICGLIPFSLILIFSILVVYKIFKSKSNLQTFYSTKENSTFKKDAKIAIIIISTNFITVILFTFAFITHYYSERFSYYNIILFRNIFYLQYVGHFYFFIITNSMFRNAFYALICCKKVNIISDDDEIELS